MLFVESGRAGGGFEARGAASGVDDEVLELLVEMLQLLHRGARLDQVRELRRPPLDLLQSAVGLAEPAPNDRTDLSFLESYPGLDVSSARFGDDLASVPSTGVTARGFPQNTLEIVLAPETLCDTHSVAKTNSEFSTSRVDAAPSAPNHSIDLHFAIDTYLGRFQSDSDDQRVPTTRAVRGSPEHSPSSSPDTVSPILINQRNSESILAWTRRHRSRSRPRFASRFTASSRSARASSYASTSSA